MQQAYPDVAAELAASLSRIERRARGAMRTLDAGGAVNGRTALLEIANEAADARRAAADRERELERAARGLGQRWAPVRRRELVG